MSDSRWIPLESNPEVMNEWAESVGLLEGSAEFVDVYGLDPELLAMVPRPVKAVILLFPLTGGIDDWRKSEDDRIAAEGQPAIDPTVFWIKQTIGNACGTIGLLHALANSDVAYVPESPLQKFIDLCKDKTPQERAHILDSTSLFASAHHSAASSGQTAVPSDLDTDLHFTCFVQAPEASARESQVGTGVRRLIELDGRRAGPVDRGESENLLEDTAAYVKEHVLSRGVSIHFSMIALAGRDSNSGL
ncbi:peptidase C12 ubiquitin carboxyl-terminal hydrolase 1 [Auriscalpium vulgare]|uniref:Peptidase C12 ubiquitin carboxyl-terminal hydrolase 1 n=1 Tax=Auriscalpium vulgare TaxID=40419 RepID=A0ACB8RSU3_9AGAM|nr:peptidase C12 ubiquitin carboxyl-terminal hydrolase 1 [Auriscalpium vulgare]